MTTTQHDTAADGRELVRTARTTGLLYLGLIISGALGYMFIRGQLFAPDDAAATLSHLVERETLARIGIVLELAIVTTQALLALWFYRLFRSVDAFLAGSIVVFGMVNSVAVLGSAAFLATALDVALNASLDGAASTAQLMYFVSDNLWGSASVFCGLWLIPMGLLVLRSRWMPRPMGWILVLGGVGYVLYAVTLHLAPDAVAVASALPWLASVGELWMAGYLLVKGIRRGDAGKV